MPLNDAEDGHEIVSVILCTTFDNKEYLRLALESIYNQRDVNVETILIFDGVSRERADNFLKHYRHYNLRAFQSAKRRGLARSLNIGIRLSSGDYIARMDDDDISCAGRLEAQLNFMNRNEVDVVGCSAKVIDANGMLTGQILKGFNFECTLSNFDLFFGLVFIHPTVMFRAEWIKKHRYNVTWLRGQDRELWVRTKRFSRFANIEEPLLYYRICDVAKKSLLENFSSSQRLIRSNSKYLGLQAPIFYSFNLMRMALLLLRLTLR